MNEKLPDLFSLEELLTERIKLEERRRVLQDQLEELQTELSWFDSGDKA